MALTKGLYVKGITGLPRNGGEKKVHGVHHTHSRGKTQPASG